MFMNTRPYGNCKAFYSSFKTNLKNACNTYWHKLLYTDISTSGKEGRNKLQTYRKFKTAIYFEKYLYINNTEKRKKIAQPKISAHKLKIETYLEAFIYIDLCLYLFIDVYLYMLFKRIFLIGCRCERMGNILNLVKLNYQQQIYIHVCSNDKCKYK